MLSALQTTRLVKASKLWGPRTSAVVPVSLVQEPVHRTLTFAQAFGLLGAPLLLAVLVSMLWTAWLVCLNVAPNATANYLMDTKAFDDGDFWLIADPEPVLLASTVLCLAAVLAMYGYVALQMTCWRNATPRDAFFGSGALGRMSFGLAPSSHAVRKAKTVWGDVTGFNGRWRKLWNTALKALDLTIQMLTLQQILEYGFTPALCLVYAALIAANALSCAYFILDARRHSALLEILTDTAFDMLFAIGAPILLLQYAYTHFEFDRARALLTHELTQAGDFDRQARLMADPVQVTAFLLNFDALRTTTWSGLGVQMAMNMSFGYRLKRVVEVLGESRRMKRRVSTRTQLAAIIQAQVRVPKVLSAFFLAVGVVAVAYAQQAIAHSHEVCVPYPECAAYAHRWEKSDACPCLAFIDTDKAPRSYAEWVSPVDVTDKVRALAASGDLQVLYVINRRLAVWPETLRRCTDLRHISLLYTGVEEIPAWARTFTRLEFLAIEGKTSETNLVRLPADLFDDMAMLMNLHFGVHNGLESLPRLDGLRRLNSLSLAVMRSLKTLPELSSLSHLARIELMFLPSLQALPNLSQAIHPTMFTLQGSALCCNGVIGVCNPGGMVCREQRPPVCVTESDRERSMSAAMRSLLAAHSASMCNSDVVFRSFSLDDMFAAPAKEQIDKCSGIQYRECAIDDSGWSDGRAMCFSSRMQVVHCSIADDRIALRRAEIRLGVGTPCDPRVEAWLGCFEA